MKYFHLTEKLQIGVRIFYVNPEKKILHQMKKEIYTNARFFCKKKSVIKYFLRKSSILLKSKEKKD